MNSYVAGAGNIFLYWYCCALNLFQSNRSCQIDGTFPGWEGGSFIYLFVAALWPFTNLIQQFDATLPDGCKVHV